MARTRRGPPWEAERRSPAKEAQLPRRTLAALLAAAATAVAAAPARADDSTIQTISGSPLTITVGGRGQMQALRAGDTDRIFYRFDQLLGDAGFFLAFPAPQPVVAAGSVFGFTGTAGPYGLTDYTEVSQGAVTGAGTAASPFQQVTNYATAASGPRVTVKQTTTYVNGAEQFDVRWDVTNSSGQPLRYKAIVAADFFFEGSDRGTGIFTLGPPRFVGGTNADTGRSGGFVEVTSTSPPWSHYQAFNWPGIWTDRVQVAGDSASPTLDDTIEGEPDDNAGGVEWDDALAAPVANGAMKSYELIVRSSAPAALQFDKTNAGSPQKVPITFVATAKDTAGVPFTSKPLRFAITGANPLAGTATIDGNGNASIIDPGTNAGADTIVAYVDLNNDSTREANEPQASTLATFVDNIPPACTVKVTGDRPGGGGAGKPLVITVNCDSPATVTTASTFTITPKRAHASAKSRKKVVVKLPVTSATVQPGEAVPVSIKVPKKVAKKYAGATVTAKVVVTATDGAGNKATNTATRKLKLRAVKKRR
jgi:hypothetical protein